MARAVVSLKVIKTQRLKGPDLIRTDYRYKFADKGKALERLGKYFGMYEKDNLQKPAQEKKPDRWVVVPTYRELTLAEWSQQVEELNRLEAEKRHKEKATLQWTFLRQTAGYHSTDFINSTAARFGEFAPKEI